MSAKKPSRKKSRVVALSELQAQERLKPEAEEPRIDTTLSGNSIWSERGGRTAHGQSTSSTELGAETSSSNKVHGSRQRLAESQYNQRGLVSFRKCPRMLPKLGERKKSFPWLASVFMKHGSMIPAKHVRQKVLSESNFDTMLQSESLVDAEEAKLEFRALVGCAEERT